MESGATDRKIDQLIHLLVKNATVVVPGPKIASQIGVSNSTIWLWIEKLRRLGVTIQGVTASGYQLRSLPDLLVPSLIRPELGENQIGGKLIHYFCTGSTNDVALRLAAQGAPHGTVVVAEEQTAGRGRMGRKWFSEKSSGIYCSVILRPPLSPALAPVLTLMAGVSACQTLRSVTGLAVDIRWPNDLLINDRKVCGILTEMSAEVDRLHAVVVGIGINVNHRAMPAEIKTIATSLALESGKPYSRANIFILFLKELGRYYEMLLTEGSGAIVKAWAAASTYASGKRIRVVSHSGEFTATTDGLDSNGALRVIRDDGERDLLVSGEIVEIK
jgi:BirA family biotin operon repressor/biotin-[acetyl-CoA-carboxylase] ligase